MPPLRTLYLLPLLILMDLLAGFAVLVGSGILAAVSVHETLFWLLLMAGAVGALCGLIVTSGAVPSSARQSIVVVVGLTVSAGTAIGVDRTLPGALILLITMGLLYWRGLVATQEPPDHDDVRYRFGFGFALLFLGIILAVARGHGHSQSTWQVLAILGITYTIVSMVALGLARVEEVREPGAGRAVAIAIGVQTMFLVAVGIGALEFLAIDVGSGFLRVTRPLWQALDAVVQFVLLLVAVPIAAVMQHVHLHVQMPRNNMRAISHYMSKSMKQQHHLHFNNTPWLTPVAGILIGVLVAGVALLIWQTAPRVHRRPQRRAYVERRHSLLSVAIVLRRLWQRLQKLFHQSERELKGVTAAAVQRFSRPNYSSDSVRRTYAQMLKRAEVTGLPRRPDVTPEEFSAQLRQSWPDGESDFRSITDAYQTRRYGDIALPELQIRANTRRWQRVREVMREASRLQKPAVSIAHADESVSESSPATNAPHTHISMHSRLSGWVTRVRTRR